MAIIIRAYFVKKKGFSPLKDVVIQSMLLSGVSFLLLCTFAVAGNFTDELDNMRGGMIIAKGGVLYRDYVTQHTSVAYYLCAVFAALGAASVEQFRLSYYIFEALIWGLLYLRHESYFGKKKMIILPILECIFISSIVTPQGFQILSDGIQGICMVALSLEFIRYYNDKKLGWSRSLIVSICIWGSFGAAFVSAYALIWIVAVVIIIEIKSWKGKRFCFAKAWKRYWKLLSSVIMPFLCTIIYFEINHSLRRSFEQFYSFNREVYSKYTGIGEKLRQPFIDAVRNFFRIIADSFNSIVTSTATNIVILQLITAVLATMVIILLASKKRGVEAFLLFMVMCCSATRGYGFHGLAAWYVSIMLIALFYEELIEYMPKIGLPFAGIIAVFIFSTYVENVGNNLLYKQPSVSEIESTIVMMTNDGEGILIDASCCDTLYFLYKDRYPVNRAVYMLPWYMDWYEQDTIQDLINHQPNVVVYYEEQDVWSYTHYANAFTDKIKENYTQLSNNPDDWRYKVWVRNN